jgi:hypothetical protein
VPSAGACAAGGGVRRHGPGTQEIDFGAKPFELRFFVGGGRIGVVCKPILCRAIATV